MLGRKPRRAPRSRQRLEQQGAAPASRRVRDAGPVWQRSSRIGSLLLLGISILFLVQFLTSARFRIGQVTIDGASLVAHDEIEALADLANRSIFALNARQVEARILESYGCLGRVRVQARLPGQVHIQVHEKDTLLLWHSHDAYWWVDSEGRVLGEANSHGDLPRVHDRSHLPVASDEYIVGVPWEFVARMSRALPTASDFEFTLEDGLILVDARGWPVYLGIGGDAEQKALLLEQLTKALDERGDQVVYIDLKNERRPAVKVESG
jgi:cell division septal protein FtsQ